MDDGAFPPVRTAEPPNWRLAHHFLAGHSATAFQGLFFLCLFIAGKNGAPFSTALKGISLIKSCAGAFAVGATFPRGSVLQSRMLRLTVAASPALLAGWICTTSVSRRPDRPIVY